MAIIRHQKNSENSIPKVIVVFPAKNEASTIENSIATAKQSYYKPDVILVDAFSADKTTQLDGRAGAIVIQQPTKIFPAKGLAVGSVDKSAIEFQSGHVGLIIGQRAHQEVWPKVGDWLRERS